MIDENLSNMADGKLLVDDKYLVDTKHLSSIKMLTNLTYLLDLTIDENLDCIVIRSHFQIIQTHKLKYYINETFKANTLIQP